MKLAGLPFQENDLGPLNWQIHHVHERGNFGMLTIERHQLTFKAAVYLH